jgi:hypothetical protein
LRRPSHRTRRRDAGAVSTLFVANPLDVNVLLYEGEELVGAKENRILDRPILVAAQSKTPVPVTCVERGRWSYRASIGGTTRSFRVCALIRPCDRHV